jgi:hypothetical protein
MNEHERCREAIPLYAAATLEPGERSRVESHLAVCGECRDDLALWKGIAAAVMESIDKNPAPPAPLERALAETRRRTARVGFHRLRLAFDLVKWQAAILRQEIWPALAVVTAIGLAAAFLTGIPGLLRLLAPLIAAASLAAICGRDGDPALELISATPISPGKILLARATLIFSYNLALAVLSAALLGTAFPGPAFPALILDWLGPMAFLSALALALSLFFGTTSAVTIAYLAWLLRFLPSSLVRGIVELIGFPALRNAVIFYRSFWESPALLLPLAAALTLMTLKLADRREIGRQRLTPES